MTSVNFAVVQIIVLSLFAVVGMTLRQLPGVAFRSPTDYANEMDRIHSIYDAALGTAVVDALERLQVWHIFSSTWFSIGLVVLIISIVACTIDRTPRRTAVRSSGTSAKISPGLDATSSAGRYLSNKASACGCETIRSTRP